MLALLRRKIQKKFKRNRQKLNDSEVQDERPEIPEDVQMPAATSSSINGVSSPNCEIMKKELFKLAWYWPGLSRLEAQKLLSAKQNGSFLLRDSDSSSAERDSFTLSFRTNSKTFHCRNQWWELLPGDLVSMNLISDSYFRSQILADKSTSHTLIDIIENTIKKSQSSVVGFVKCDNNDLSFPTSFAVRLIYPICREVTVPSLQSLCLSQIKSKVNQSNINSLPLPNRIKEYVHDNYNTL